MMSLPTNTWRRVRTPPEYWLCARKFGSRTFALWRNHCVMCWMRVYTLRLFSHESKVRNLNLNLKCAFWSKIWKMVFWTVCMPNYITMHHLKCAFQMTVRRCFPVNASRKSHSEITVWMPWPLNCDFGGGAKWPSNHFRLYTARCIYNVYRSSGNASSVHVWLAGYPDILLPLWNAKSQIRSLVCTLRNSYIAITSLVCTLRNSKCAFQMIIQITQFALMWKQSVWLRSCLFCEGRISVLKRWFKTPLIQAIVRAQVNRKGVYMTSFKRGYNVILRSCFHQNQRFALTTIVNAHFWAAFMLILQRRFETLIQNADPKRRSWKYCSCFPREEDDTFTEEGMSRNSRNV